MIEYRIRDRVHYKNKKGEFIPCLMMGESGNFPKTQTIFDLTDLKVKHIEALQINSSEEYQYLNLLLQLRNQSEEKRVTLKDDRTGTGTLSTFGHQMRFNLQNGFPLLTTKKVHFKSIVHELLWFLKGDTNTKYLEDNGVTIWREWQDENGDLGRIYGFQWRNFGGIDQIQTLIDSLQNNPNSRRHIVSAWNVGELDQMALPPCHTLWQCYVANGKLSLQLYQRSADVFLGLPFNIASYALLTHLLAKACDLEVGDLIMTLGDAHLYLNHQEQADTQLSRIPTPFPKLVIREKKNIFDYTFEDITLENYNPQPAIKAPVAV